VSSNSGQRAKALISQPYCNWKDAKSDLAKHATLHYYQNSKALMDGFQWTMKEPENIIENRLSVEIEKRVLKNRAFLKSILKCTEFCGHQGIALRGHRDDSTSEAMNTGNFRALIDLRMDAGDSELREHMDTCARNATYVSKTAQNKLLQCIKEYMHSSCIVQGVWTGRRKTDRVH